jgi:predicted metal-dependent peptidase
MTQDLNTLLNKTKGQLFFQKTAGFLGRLLAQVEFQWVNNNPKITTAAISSKTLYWDVEFFLSRTPAQRVTVLAHELWHNGLLHGARMGKRDPKIWNYAGDHVINLRLEEDGYDMSGFDYLMDHRFKGMSTEEVYDILIQEKPPSNPNDMSGDIIPCEGPADVQDAVGKTVAAVTAARLGGMDPGSLPGEISQVIDEFLNPKLPWETLLFNYFNELTTEEYSYSRPNRRYEDPLLPGKSGRNGLEHLIYYQDISGSITDENIVRFNSELKFVWEEFQPQKMTVVTFDTKIHDIYVFEEGDDFHKIEITGRGGTDLRDVYKHMKKEAPNAAVIFTDLEVRIPPNPGIPIIWVCTDNPHGKVPYGRLIHVDD